MNLIMPTVGIYLLIASGIGAIAKILFGGASVF